MDMYSGSCFTVAPFPSTGKQRAPTVEISTSLPLAELGAFVPRELVIEVTSTLLILTHHG